jgi:tetratricopeptide (TPR) repeat protein
VAAQSKKKKKKSLPPLQLEAQLVGAQAAAAAGDAAGARRLVEQAIEGGADMPAASFMHGALCLQLGDAAAAVPSLQRAMQSSDSPGAWRAATNLSVALRQLERWPEAIDAAQRAVRLQPNLITAHVALAHGLHGDGQLSAALSGAREALRLFEARTPQPPEATCEPPRTLVGELLVESGELREAWECAIRAAEEARTPGGGEAAVPMAHACVLAGRVQSAAEQWEKALDAYAKAAKLHPDGAARANALRLQAITPALRAGLPARPDDVFISTFPKSGTTWMQQVVCMLAGEPADVDIQMRAPYIEAAIATTAFSLEALRRMRSVRTAQAAARTPPAARVSRTRSGRGGALACGGAACGAW